MSEAPASKLDRIRKLIAKAQGTDHAEEADAFQRAAEKLMLKYSVEEWEVMQAGGPDAKAAKPEMKDKIFICPTGHHCAHALATLAAGLGRHLNVAVSFSYLGVAKHIPGFDILATAIGYPEDLRMWETIFTVLHLQMLGQIDPNADIEETFDANVHALHKAGVKWVEIARRMNEARESALIRFPGREIWAEVKWPDGGRLKRSARKEATRVGEEYVIVSSPKGYQRSFAEAFRNTVLRRFAEARAKESTSGTTLVLRNKFAAVQEYQNEVIPGLKETVDKSKTKFNADGYKNGRKAGEEADLNLDSRFGAEKQGELA